MESIKEKRKLARKNAQINNNEKFQNHSALYLLQNKLRRDKILEYENNYKKKDELCKFIITDIDTEGDILTGNGDCEIKSNGKTIRAKRDIYLYQCFNKHNRKTLTDSAATGIIRSKAQN